MLLSMKQVIEIDIFKIVVRTIKGEIVFGKVHIIIRPRYNQFKSDII